VHGKLPTTIQRVGWYFILVTGYPLQNDWVIDGMGSRPDELSPTMDEISWHARDVVTLKQSRTYGIVNTKATLNFGKHQFKSCEHG
jgi:hypothetical protein